MPEIDPVILQLKADVDRYQTQVKAATRTVDQQLGRQEARVKRLENEMRRSSGAISSTFKTLAGTLAAVFTGRELVGLIDSFTRFQNQLKVAGLEGEALAKVQDRLRTIGSQYGVELEGLANVFSRVSQVQNELGASSEQIIQLNEIIAASLKVAGTDAQSASGALLQLSQALGSGTVRAEEFNSILEGALPLAQAAARGIEGMGGSVAKLRAEVVEGNISSKEFFDGVLRGGVDTIKQAENATLTLSGAFTALRNELTLYFGEASKSSGATAALATAIQKLADNLDTIIPAIATLALGLGVGFVTNAARARLAAVATTGALATMGTVGAATGRALLAAFGGPVGVAITALTLAVAAFASELSNAEARAEDFRRGTEELNAKTLELEGRMRDAGIAVDGFGDAADGAKRKVDNLSNSIAGAIKQAVGLIGKMIQLESVQLQFENNALNAALEGRERARKGGVGYIFSAQGTRDFEVAKGVRNEFGALSDQEIRARIAANERRQNAVLTAAENNVSVTSPSPSGAGGATTTTGTKAKPGAKGSTPTGPSLAEIEDRFQNERANYMQRYNSALGSMALNAEEAAEYELRNVELAKIRTIESIRNDQDYSEAQKARLVAQVDELAEVEREAVERQKRIALEREAQEIADERYAAEQDSLRLQFDLADTQSERKALALQILEAEDRYLKSKLEAVLASETATDIEKERARIALESLNATAAARRKGVERANQTAVEAYLDDLNKSKDEINEAIDGIKIDGLEALNDGIVDAIMGTKSLGEVFKNVADQIIADLLRIAIQQAIIKPLAESLFGGGGGLNLGSGGNSIVSGEGGGIFDILGGIFGRASGGYVAPGRLYRVNEGASPGRVEAFRPNTGGEIIPLGQMNAMQSGQTQSGVATVRLELSGDIDARIERVSGPVAIEVVRGAAPTIVDASANEALRRASRPGL